jgi:hypothetical protein
VLAGMEAAEPRRLAHVHVPFLVVTFRDDVLAMAVLVVLDIQLIFLVLEVAMDRVVVGVEEITSRHQE